MGPLGDTITVNGIVLYWRGTGALPDDDIAIYSNDLLTPNQQAGSNDVWSNLAATIWVQDIRGEVMHYWEVNPNGSIFSNTDYDAQGNNPSPGQTELVLVTTFGTRYMSNFQPLGDGVMDDPSSEDNMTGSKGFKKNKGFTHRNGFTAKNGFTKENGF